MKSLILHGVVAGILSGIAGIIYLNTYQEAFYTDYGSIINTGSILGACVISCMLMTLGYAAIIKLNKKQLIGWMNILIAIVSFASIIGPIGMNLPLDIEYPELFPGLVVPMHFFPALSFFAIYPFFKIK